MWLGLAANRLDQSQTIARAGQVKIDEYHIDCVLLQHPHCRSRLRCLKDLESPSFEQQPVGEAHVRLVIDDEHYGVVAVLLHSIAATCR